MAVGTYGIRPTMGNYKPNTFRELIEPVLLVELGRKELEEKMERYEEEFGKLNLPNTSLYYNTLLQWRDDYDSAAEAFASGYGSRKDLTALFRRARKDIAPIKEAITARNKDLDDFRKMKIQDSSLIVDEDAFNIDNYIGGNIPDIKAISGNAVEADAAATIDAYAKQHPLMPKIIGNLRDAFVTLLVGGMENTDKLQEAISRFRAGDYTTQEDDAALNEFVGILGRLRDKYAKAGYTDKLLNDITNRIISGAFKGVPATQYNMLQSPGYTTPYQGTQLLLAKATETRQAYNDAMDRTIKEMQLGLNYNYFNDGNNNFVFDPERGALMRSLMGYGDTPENKIQIDVDDYAVRSWKQDNSNPAKPRMVLVWITTKNGEELTEEEVRKKANEYKTFAGESYLGYGQFLNLLKMLQSDVEPVDKLTAEAFEENFTPYYFAGHTKFGENGQGLSADTFEGEGRKIEPEELEELFDDINNEYLIRMAYNIAYQNGVKAEDLKGFLPKDNGKFSEGQANAAKQFLKANFDFYQDHDFWSKNNWKVLPKKGKWKKRPEDLKFKDKSTELLKGVVNATHPEIDTSKMSRELIINIIKNYYIKI